MKEQHSFYVPDLMDRGWLPDDEAKHAVRVLRLSAGDPILLLNGRGTVAEAHVDEASPKRCSYVVDRQRVVDKGWQAHLHLAIAPTKHIDRTEWLVEKATELGFDELTFLRTQFAERTTLRLDRIERIVTAAMKQSRNAYRPIVNDLTPFPRFLETLLPSPVREDLQSSRTTHRTYIAHCYDDIPREDLFSLLTRQPTITQPSTPGSVCRVANATPITVLIGPEGDFSIDEVRAAMQRGCRSVSLGLSRLRTETAGLAAVMMMQLAQHPKLEATTD